MKLSELKTGEIGLIKEVKGEGSFRKRILEMGFVAGKEVKVILNAPLNDPVYYRLMGYNVSLRRKDAELVDVVKITPEESIDFSPNDSLEENDTPSTISFSNLKKEEVERHSILSRKERKKIRVALVGNPNSGKTSIFNIASGKSEKVGNYSGVTVEAHTAHFDFGDYYIEIVDLPGSYSLSPYSPEELFIRDYLSSPSTRPDVVIDVVDTTNIERSLYLTVQLKELGLPLVVALNMYDEFCKSKAKLQISKLSDLFDTPLVPTIGRNAYGVDELLSQVVSLYENQKNPHFEDRDIRISYGSLLEPRVQRLTDEIATTLGAVTNLPPRYLAVRLLEEDKEVHRYISSLPNGDTILSFTKGLLEEAQNLLGHQKVETLITDQRYGFIAGALRETLQVHRTTQKTLTDKIDHILLHRVWGFPIFILFLLLMFQCTFTLGAFPQAWIESLVAWIGGGLASVMPKGPFTDLLVDGIIGGVGGVIVFLPQIIILYFFISLMEDTGYMARATFLMDRLMHGMGLHGKSFIPLIMGFGCNVPAIMATRTIESKQSRLITILVNPLMSCSARLPVYILLAGAFFPHRAGLVLFSLYALGILLAIAMAWIFRKAMFKKEDLPFVMELPPYRLPTKKAVAIHMWDRSKMYLTKMGTVILAASIVIWLLGYFPRKSIVAEKEYQIAQVEKQISLDETAKSEQIAALESHYAQKQQEQSYLGKIGKGLQPVLSPLGFDWKMSIAIASGLPAKEVVVSTLGVIYTGNGDDSDATTTMISEKLQQDVDAHGNKVFTPLVALTFMIFVLIYFPCIATVTAIGREAGSWKWTLFVIAYTCVLAWIVSFIVYQGGLLLGFS